MRTPAMLACSRNTRCRTTRSAMYIWRSTIGNVLEAQGNLPAALDSYRAGLAIIARLAKTQPGTAGFQHDLAVSYSHVAMVEARQGDRADALAKFRQGRDSITWLIQQSPDDPTFSNELAWFDQQIADLPK